MIKYLSRQSDNSISVEPTEAMSQWVHLYPPFEVGELEELAEQYDVPLDFFTDALDIDERSRYEREENANLILINTPLLNEDGKDSEAIYITFPIGIILVSGIIITISARENPIIEKFLDNKVKNFDPHDRQKFILQIFEQNVYRFLECLKKLNLKRNLIEEELANSYRSKELQQLLRIEKSLVYFVNSLSANELLKMKMKRTDLLQIRDNEDLTDLFEDIIIDNSQALEMSNVYTNILSSTMEAYASIIGNNMNHFINRLTLITIALMVPTLVASFFGMNVPLPFADNKYGFWIIIMVSILLIGGMVVFFRTRRRL
jgi:magnesium transporter